MIFLSAQPANVYFRWQIEVFINNLCSFGVLKESIHILFSIEGEISPEVTELITEYKELASFYFYTDTRESREYLSSVRPHIIAKHFDLYPDLQFSSIFYHDTDIIFRDIPKFDDLIQNSTANTWLMSDTDSYTGISYLNSINEKILFDLCNIIKVDIQKVLSYLGKFGGAQYLVKNVPISFWLKHERDSETIFKTLNDNLGEYEKYTPKSLPSSLSNRSQASHLQIWCSDMWSFFLNAIFFGKEIIIDKELDFSWPHETIDSWNTKKIFHNAGVTEEKSQELFFKGNYQNKSPFREDLSFVNTDKCSIKYVDAIYHTLMSKRYHNQNVAILIILSECDQNKERLLLQTLKYLRLYFVFEINVWVIESNNLILDIEYIQNLGIKFKQIRSNSCDCCSEKFLEDFLKNTDKEIVFLLDVGIFPVPERVVECIKVFEKDYALAFPFNGTINHLKEGYLRLLECKNYNTYFFENETFSLSIFHSFEGAVLIKRDKYLQHIAENNIVTHYKEENLNRVMSFLSAGERAFRSKNELYSLRLGHN